MHGVETFDVLGRGQLIEVVEPGDGLVDGGAGVGARRRVSRRRSGNRPRCRISLCVHASTLTDRRRAPPHHADIHVRSQEASARSAVASPGRTDVTGSAHAR